MNMNPTPRESRFSLWSVAGLVVAAVMVAGSLHMTLGLGLKACPLCIYERSFAMAVAALLLMGVLFPPGERPGGIVLLALPLAAAGLGVAAFHVYLDRSGVLECPPGILEIGHAPDQSLAGFVLLTALLAGGAWAGRRHAAMVLGLVLGAALAFAAIKSAPPLPPPNPTYAADGKRILAGCEPAVREPSGKP